MSKPVLVYIPTRGGDRSPQTNMKKTTCKNCTRPLTAPAEPEAGQWIVCWGKSGTGKSGTGYDFPRYGPPPRSASTHHKIAPQSAISVRPYRMWREKRVRREKRRRAQRERARV